jgi:hypothetical protein
LTFDKVDEQKLDNFIDDLERRFDNVKLQSDDEIPSVAWYPRSLNDLRNSLFNLKYIYIYIYIYILILIAVDSIKLDVKDEIN